MRPLILALPLLLISVMPVQANGNHPPRVAVNVGYPGINIGINVPVYPELIQVPGYPVYYDPRAHSNYFFYDGLYWVYHGDNWYQSSWYNGPWQMEAPDNVPLFVLRIPVRYYRQPPVYFRGWQPDAPPRWGEHWGRTWEQRRGGWDRWDQRTTPAAVPLPMYQHQYSGDRYPRAGEQQHKLQSENYRLHLREPQREQPREFQLNAPYQSAPPPRYQPPGKPAYPYLQPQRPQAELQDKKRDEKSDSDNRGRGRNDDREDGHRDNNGRGPDRR